MKPVIPSPCVRNCCLNEDDVCLGCFRSLAEITQWSVTTNETRQMILLKAEARRDEYQRRMRQI
jgi:predicted Fe-S protein YdhL (DUF1289 family)